MKRKIIIIDEDLCDGCGNCITSCEEGALQIIDGKAKLVNPVFCDGLGNCLGECPTGALTIEEKDVPAFDMKAVETHLSKSKVTACPGSSQQQWKAAPTGDKEATIPSGLGNWPIQLMLVPPQAPYLQNCDLVIAADCTAFAHGSFHSLFLDSTKPLLIACPKLDNVSYYLDKLADIFRLAEIRSIELLLMEVPCCSGLQKIVQEAMKMAEKEIPLKTTVIGVRGDIKG